MTRKLAAAEVAEMPSDEVAFTELFRTPVVCIPADEVDKLLPYVGSAFPIVAVDDALLAELSSPVNERLFLSAPPCIVAMLTLNAANLMLLDQVRNGFLALNAAAVPAPAVLTLGNASSIVSALAGGISHTIEEQAKLISRQSREVAQLRQQNEQLQNQLHSLEAFLDRRGEQPCELVFTSPPALGTEEDYRLKLANDQRLGQLLPVASQGVCGFGLYVDVPGGSDCQFIATMQSLEDGLTIGSWQIQANQLRSGWNTFALDKSVAGLRRSIRLDLSSSGSGKPPTLALGEIQPVVRFQAWDFAANQPLSHRNFAIKVYAGLPGLMVPDWFSSPAGDVGGFREAALDPTRLATARQTGFNAPVSYDEVVYLADEKALLCHPPKVGTTVAEMADVLPKGTIRVSAIGYLPNKQSKSVELRLRAVAPASGSFDETIVAESAWMIVEPNQSVVINAFFSRPVTASASVEFLARMKEQGNSDYAWAKFRDISIVRVVEAN